MSEVKSKVKANERTYVQQVTAKPQVTVGHVKTRGNKSHKSQSVTSRREAIKATSHSRSCQDERRGQAKPQVTVGHVKTRGEAIKATSHSRSLRIVQELCESRWPSWVVRPNEPSGFRGRKELLNRASALVTCP